MALEVQTLKSEVKTLDPTTYIIERIQQVKVHKDRIKPTNFPTCTAYTTVKKRCDRNV